MSQNRSAPEITQWMQFVTVTTLRAKADTTTINVVLYQENAS